MTGFEPQTSGIRSDRSTNWATTTAHTCKSNWAIEKYAINPIIIPNSKMIELWQKKEVTDTITKVMKLEMEKQSLPKSRERK